MALSAFDDPSEQPQAAALSRVLGETAALWPSLLAHLGEAFAPVTELWSFSGAKFGWSLRAKQGDRIILYMTPQQGSFLVGLVLGEKAAQAARASDLPASVLALIESAPKYAEGRGIRIPVASASDLAAVQRLAALKMAPQPSSPRGKARKPAAEPAPKRARSPRR